MACVIFLAHRTTLNPEGMIGKAVALMLRPMLINVVTPLLGVIAWVLILMHLEPQQKVQEMQQFLPD